MASIQNIAKAKTTGLIFKAAFGIEPQYDYQADHVRLFYTGNDLIVVQKKINDLAKKKKQPGDIRIDLLPMVAPAAINQVLPYALAAVAAGYLLGKIV